MNGAEVDYLAPDWSRWLKRETLTVVEAAALWCGIEPATVKIEGGRVWIQSASGGFLLSQFPPAEFFICYDLVHSALDVSLTIVNPVMLPKEHPRFEAVVFVNWARTRHPDRPLPAPLGELMREGHGANMVPGREPAVISELAPSHLSNRIAGRSSEVPEQSCARETKDENNIPNRPSGPSNTAWDRYITALGVTGFPERWRSISEAARMIAKATNGNEESVRRDLTRVRQALRQK